MNSRLLNITRTVWVLALLGLFVSCQDTIPNRSTITAGSSTDDTPVCTANQVLVEETDANGIKTKVCKDKATVRPDGSVFWKSDFCACKDNKPVSYGNCSSFCSDKNTSGAEILYANFTVSEAISLGGLGNMYAWCRTPLQGDTANPECELQAKDESGNITSVEVNVPLNKNSLTANIGDKLAYDKTYVLTLVEKVSGAKSNSVQMIKFSSDTNLGVLGPLKQAPISQYSCMVRQFSEDNAGNVYYDSAYRTHYYFVPRVPPRPIPAGNSFLICHDIFNPLYGLVDQETYPRFEQLAGVFNLWDTTDPRFYDNNGNGATDVNEIIIQKTKNFGGTIPANSDFFRPFKWLGAPAFENESGNTTLETLGHFMAPWIDQSTYKSYCPNSTHYQGSNPLFKALGDVIQVNTEGIYAGVKAPETVTDSDGNTTTGACDVILIRETDLKQVWFYLKNNVPTVPTDDNVANVAVYFYYPLNKSTPFVKTSTQRTFRVYSASELNTLYKTCGSTNNNSQNTNTNGSTSGGTQTNYPPHDRKIGCVPKF